MTSLRRRLLLSAAVAIVAVGVLCASLAYLQVSHDTRTLLDDQIKQIARLAARTIDGSEIRGGGDEDIVVSVWGTDRKLKFSTAPALAVPVPEQGFLELPLNGQPYRIYSTVISGQHITVAQPVDIRDDQAEAAALAAFLPLLVLVPVLTIVLGLVIRAQLRPVRKLASDVAQRRTFEHIELTSSGLPAEVMPLVDEINRLLARQNAAAQRERQFVADAAHALRTPLAALQLQADVLEGANNPAEYAARFADLRAGIRRAALLSEQLLQIAHGVQADPPQQDILDVDAVLREVLDLYHPAAATAGITLWLQADTGAKLRASSRNLLLIFGNLVDNALRHSPPGAVVALRAEVGDGTIRVEVQDEGPGIAPGDLGRVFEPFFRASGDQGSGSGLGLATVEGLVKELGGEVRLSNREDRSGLRVSVALPQAS